MLDVFATYLPVADSRRAAAARMLRVLLLVLALLPAVPGLAQVAPGLPGAPSAAAPRIGPVQVDAVEAELIADVARAVPGQPFRLGLRLKHDAAWHTYWRNPGDSGLPTRFEPAGPPEVTYGDIAWPAPQRLAIGDLANYGYEGEVVLARQVTLPLQFAAGRARFQVQAQWLVCKDVCIPGEASLALDLPVGPQAAPASPKLLGWFDDSAMRAPDPAVRLTAGWWQQGNEALLLLPSGTSAERAEFFPYFEGVVRPAADQSLVQANPAEAGLPQRLAMRLALVDARPIELAAAVAPRAAAGAADSPAPADGLLLLDGKPHEVSLARLETAPSLGKVLSVAEVVPPAPASSGGLLDRLRGGGRSSLVAPGAAVAPSSSSNVALAARPFPAQAPSPGADTLAIALFGALVGGLILNLMPCVFPVIGLKVLAFSQAAAGEPRHARRHALSFSVGVVLSFVVLGMVMLALRAAGEAAGWGFQMQSPLFVGAMALLFVLIGLNLFGVFETGLSLTRLSLARGGAGGAAAPEAAAGGGHGLQSSFLTGVLAVLVATPCTAPFMGSAVGYTIGSPPLQTLLVFAALGVGMALPYLALGSAPGLLRWLPRPGPWLLVFKQLLAFPMLATAAWLAWVLTLQAGPDGLLRLLMAAVLLGFAAWIYGRAQSARFAGRSWPGLAGLAAALLAGILTLWQMLQIEPIGAAASVASVGSAAAVTSLAPVGPAASKPASKRLDGVVDQVGASAPGLGRAGEDTASRGWQAWSPQRVSEALEQGHPVLVDFTAAWCISCQANKKLVLERQAIKQAFDAQRVTLLRADWTSQDPAITAELARFGRNGVPLYLVYHSAEEPPLMLPELLTVDVVLAALAAGR
jgi:thiol:disulfide interchange protein/DsbC/DsbD-like thiol-disulfide interchange protein